MEAQHEQDRLESLHSYGVADARPDIHLDAIAALAAHAVGTPMACITFVDEDRVWVKAAYGVEHGVASLEEMICTTVVREGTAVVAGDLLAHPDLHDHPAVHGPLGLRAYAGVPLVGRDALPLGVLCTLSPVPHVFSPRRMQALETLAERVVSELELRRLDRLAGRSATWRGVDVTVARRLRQALDRGELVAHYQPVVALESGLPGAFEALLRWEHPVRGSVPPGEFLHALEGGGLLRPVERAVLRQSLTTLAELVRDPGHVPGLAIGVNVAAVHVGRRGFADDVLRERDRLDLADGVLGIEVTETTDLLDSATALAELRTLREHGVGIALDDYGAGYSSLLRVLDLPISVLKIDRDVVRRLPHDRRALAATRSTLGLCTDLGLVAVAEGVETAAQRDALLDLGCAFGQGFLYSPALPAADVADYLRHPRGTWRGVPTPRARSAGHLHHAHAYAAPAELADGVGSYLADGLRAGGEVRVVAVEEHHRRIEADLAHRGVAVDRARREGRYARVDADDVVADIDRRGSVGASFARHVVPALASRSAGPLQVYGEVVGLLWSSGRTREALELEALWNGLQEHRSFDLYCGYDAASLIGTPDGLDEVARHHTHVRGAADPGRQA